MGDFEQVNTNWVEIQTLSNLDSTNEFFFALGELQAFFISNVLISNTRLKLGEKIAKS